MLLQASHPLRAPLGVLCPPSECTAEVLVGASEVSGGHSFDLLAGRGLPNSELGESGHRSRRGSAVQLVA